MNPMSSDQTLKRLPRWIIIWLCLSTLELLDFSLFVLFRPDSMPGGGLDFLWRHYVPYLSVDLSFGDVDNPFVYGQAVMTLFEVAIAAAAVTINYRGRLELAALLAFATSALTGAKTALIFVVELASGLGNVGHNDATTLFLLFVLPNAVWIVLPLLTAVTTGRILISGREGQLTTRPAS